MKRQAPARARENGPCLDDPQTRGHVVRALIGLGRELGRQGYAPTTVSERLGQAAQPLENDFLALTRLVASWLWGDKSLPFVAVAPAAGVPAVVLRAANQVMLRPAGEDLWQELAVRCGMHPDALTALTSLPDVIVALLRRHEQEVAVALDGIIEGYRPGRTRADLIVAAVAEVSLRRPALLNLTLRHTAHPKVRAELERQQALLVVLLQEDLQADGVPSTAADAAALLGGERNSAHFSERRLAYAS